MLVAIAPQTHRETVAFTLRSRRPSAEVETVPPGDPDRAVACLRPDVVVCHDVASGGAREGVRHRVEIPYSDGLDARVVADGREERVGDVSVERMLSVVDEAEKGTTSSPG